MNNYGEAWPLSEDYHLCVYDAAAGTHESGGLAQLRGEIAKPTLE